MPAFLVACAPRTLVFLLLGLLFGCQSPPATSAMLAALPRSQLTTEATTQLADGHQAARIDAQVRADDARPLGGVEVFLYCEDADVSFTQPPLTDANGHASAYVRSTSSGAKWIQALVSGADGIRTVGRGVHVTFADAGDKHPMAPVVPPASLVLHIVHDAATADGRDQVVLAAEGHRLRGQRVTFVSDNASDTFTHLAGTADANGMLCTGVSSTQAGPRRVTAQAGALSAQATIVLLAGQAEASHCVLTLTPNTQLADGVAGIDLSGAAADAFGNPVAGAALLYGSSDPCNAFSSGASATDAAGQFGITVRSAHAGTPVLSAAIASGSGSITLSANATFYAGAPDAARSSIAASPNAIALGANTQLTATVADSAGNPVAHQTVTWSATGPGNAFAPSSGQTATDGAVTSQYTPSIAGVRHISADANGALLTGDLNVYLSDMRYAQSSMALSANSLFADGVTAAGLHLVLQDFNGAPVIGEGISLSGGNGITFDPAFGVTDSSGAFDANVTTTVAQVATLLASWANVTFGVDLVVFDPP